MYFLNILISYVLVFNYNQTLNKRQLNPTPYKGNFSFLNDLQMSMVMLNMECHLIYFLPPLASKFLPVFVCFNSFGIRKF